MYIQLVYANFRRYTVEIAEKGVDAVLTLRAARASSGADTDETTDPQPRDADQQVLVHNSTAVLADIAAPGLSIQDRISEIEVCMYVYEFDCRRKHVVSA